MVDQIYLIIMGSLYMLPFIVAAMRDHKQTAPIFVVNLALGWTGLGWIICLAWSLSSNK